MTCNDKELRSLQLPAVQQNIFRYRNPEFSSSTKLLGVTP